MHYPDLTPFGMEAPFSNLRTVGWLESGHEFPIGTVATEFITQLKYLLVSPFQPFCSAGIHHCSLCQFDGPHGVNNLFVPGNGVIFIMPELAVHYMAAHHYRPPEVFQDAVLACPEIRSMDYKRALLANGGRGLVGGAG